MKIIVDKEGCIGCGTCIALAPNTFCFDADGKAEVLDPCGDDTETIKSAASACPVDVIKVEENA